MKVLFLCGGAGKRMFPLTEDKFLLDFLGKSLLERQVETAKQAGLSDFVIVASPANRAMVEETVARLHGVKFNVAVQENPSGMADAVNSAAGYLDSETIIVNPNDIFDGSVYGLLIEARQADAASTYILAKEVKSYFPGGYLVTDRRGFLREIVEKPEPGKEPSKLVNLVVHLHSDPEKLLDAIRRESPGADDAYERAINALAAKEKIKVVTYSGPWTAIKYPWQVLDAVRYFLDEELPRISSTASISPSATVDGRVTIAENVRVLENAVIRGPSYIGRNTVIGNNSLVRDYSHIGDDCVIGFSTEIKGSYLGRRCWTHMNYLGDSVIGEDCNFGAGTITANWRLDEKTVPVRIEGKPVDTGREKFGAVIGNGCRTGVNASIMPGLKIGANALVGPGVVVTTDVAPGERRLTGLKPYQRKR